MLPYLTLAIAILLWIVLLFVLPLLAIAILVAFIGIASITYFETLQMRLSDIEKHLHQ